MFHVINQIFKIKAHCVFHNSLKRLKRKSNIYRYINVGEYVFKCKLENVFITIYVYMWLWANDAEISVLSNFSNNLLDLYFAFIYKMVWFCGLFSLLGHLTSFTRCCLTFVLKNYNFMAHERFSRGVQI